VNLVDEVPFEAHHKYIDIHIDLPVDSTDNGEDIVTAYNSLNLIQSYDEERDYELYEANVFKGIADNQRMSLTPGFCVIFFPHEVHKPGLAIKVLTYGRINPTRKLIKCVVKIMDDRSK